MEQPELNHVSKKQKLAIDALDRETMASWKEVFNACFRHNAAEWAALIPVWTVCLICVYFLLLGFQLLGSGAKVMTGCQAGALFGHDQNPLTALMVGILATTFQQSSSTTIGIVISLVGVEAIDVQTGIYIVMGANIGTSITTTIVALAQMGQAEQLEGAFAGAVLHDIFNIFSVLILFPLECATGFLFYLTRSLVQGADPEDGDAWSSPVKSIAKPLAEKILISNKNVIRDVAKGISHCEDFYPIQCEDEDYPTYDTCSVGLIGCSKSTGECPAFFRANASQSEDIASGFVVFLIGIFMVFFCIFWMANMVPKIFTGVPKRIIKRGTTINGYLSIFIGAAFTMFIGSSSVALSFVPPLVGTGLVALDKMLPYTLGANLGTTLNGLLSAMATDGTESLQIALAHMFFNITAALIWFPHPFMRNIPVDLARRLGRLAGLFRGYPIFYIIFTFIAFPLYVFILSELFTTKDKTDAIIASVMTVVMVFGTIAFSWYWFFTGGRDHILDTLANRKRRLAAYETLPDDMDYIRKQLVRLAELCGASANLRMDSTDYTSQDDEENCASTGSKSSESGIRALNKEAFLKLHEQMDSIMSRLASLANFVGLDIDAEEGVTNKDQDDEIDNSGTEEDQSNDDAEPTSTRNKGVPQFLAVVPKLYVFGAFSALALYIWAITALFIIQSHTADAMAIVMLSLAGFYFLRFVFWFKFQNGEEIYFKYWINARRRKQMKLTLHNDLESINAEIDILMARSGMFKARVSR